MGREDGVAHWSLRVDVPKLSWTKTAHRGSITEKKGPAAHRRAQSSLSSRKRGAKGEFLKLDAAAMRSLFIRLFFRDSTGCVNYRARGCTLSSVRSWRLLRKRRASDSHDTFKNTRTHTNTHKLRSSQRNQSVSLSASQSAAWGHSCLLLNNTTSAHTQTHRRRIFCARRELIWRHFSSQSEPREGTGEDVGRRSSGRSSMKLFVCVCVGEEDRQLRETMTDCH